MDQLIELVRALIKTPEVKDFTSLDEWLEAGDPEDFTPQQLADEWDNLPSTERD